MTRTGWTGEGPDDEDPAQLPVTAMLLGMKERKPGDVVNQALARSRADDARQARDEAAAAYDPDEHAANLVARGYTPGLTSQLAQRLGDTLAEIQAEEEKIALGERVQARAAREHAAGRIGALSMSRMLDGDFGDEGRVRMLERRAASIRRQLGEAQDAITPPRTRDLDPVEQASRHAHDVFAETTRAMMAGERPVPSERRPFVSRGDAAVRSESCIHCVDQGVDDETSYLLHSDPELNVPVTPPGAQAQADRLEELGYSAETARYAAGMAER